MTPIVLTIKWLGHACFLITTMAGTNIVIDPFEPTVGYKAPAVKADVVFVSHEHFDHNAVGLLRGNPRVIGPLSGRTPERGTIKIGSDRIRYLCTAANHDSSGGKQRGTVTISVIEADGVRICHLGDLGHILSPSQVKAIGRVDVLMIPVGGIYTIDGRQAKQVVQQLKPKYVIPMHYKTPALKISLNTADEFLKGYKRVKHADKLRVSKGSLPEETTVVVLKY
ncbi:MAG TPA: MBL fold metallo-hydrolase [Armatimonadota bacterium]|nr:MBL fold metallo-hydrolase [Armatimonadota bacterium]